MLGATAPNQYGSPYTQTSGIQEAFTYLAPTGGEIKASEGLFLLNAPATYTSEHALKFNGVVKGNGARNSSWVINGSILMPSQSFMTNYPNQPLVTFLNTGNYNDGYLDFGNFWIIGTYNSPSTDLAAGPATNAAVGFQCGNTTSLEGNGPVSKYIHDIKFDNCAWAFTSYSGGGPSFYDNLHVDACGGDPVLGSMMAVYDLSSHWGKIECFAVPANYVIGFGSTGGYSTFALIDNLYINPGSLGVFNLQNPNGQSLLSLGKVNLFGYANDGNALFAFNGSGNWVVQAGEIYQNGSAIIRNFSTTAQQASIQIGSLYSTNSALISLGGPFTSTSSLQISKFYANSLATTPFLPFSDLPTYIEHYLPTPIPSTPAIPASGTAQQNTNLFPVEVYLNGGSVTQVTRTSNGTSYTVFSSSTGVALAGLTVRLEPGDSITLTYTTAPTWTWAPA